MSLDAYAFEMENIKDQVRNGMDIDDVDTWLTLTESDKDEILYSCGVII